MSNKDYIFYTAATLYFIYKALTWCLVGAASSREYRNCNLLPRIMAAENRSPNDKLSQLKIELLPYL